MKYGDLITRLRRLENVHGRAEPWPPLEGTMRYHQWEALGRPLERLGCLDLLLFRAAQFWKGS